MLLVIEKLSWGWEEGGGGGGRRGEGVGRREEEGGSRERGGTGMASCGGILPRITNTINKPSQGRTLAWKL